MEMLLNKVKIYIGLLLLIIQSCHSNSQEKIKITNTSSIENIDFFNKKYFDKYQFIIDESNISDHPFYNYLDCSKEGYFAVHFIPKERELQSFWKNEYFNKYYNENDYLDNENKIISKILENNLKSYNIFCYVIPKNYLQSNGDCNLESVFIKPNTIANIFYFNQKAKEWIKVKDTKANLLPPYINMEFFISIFPKKFNPDSIKQQILDSVQISNTNYTYKVLALGNKKYTNNSQVDSLTFVILDEKDNLNQIYFNKDIIFSINNNCPADGFQRLVANKDFFTIEQVYCKDFLFVQSYTTFKIDNTGNIILSKYGENYTDRGNPDKDIPSKIKTYKDFGKVYFSEVNQELLHSLIK